jgi:hypothetical protein
MTQPAPPTDQQLAAYIGPKWESRYRRKFERFRSDPRGRFRPSWNWYAALFPAWFFLHRLYGVFAVLFACALAAGLVTGPGLIFGFAFTYVFFFPAGLAWLAYHVVYSPSIGSIALLMVALALTVTQGVIADWLLYRKALAAAATIPVPEATPVPNGRPRRPPSLVSPVAAVVCTVVVGFFLGSFPLGLCACGDEERMKAWSYVDAMQSDLVVLRTAEESYFTDHGSYTSSMTALNFAPSTGGSVSITTANVTGWAATASRKDTDKTCGIFMGSATAPIAGQEEGEPRCVAAVDSLARPPSHR